VADGPLTKDSLRRQAEVHSPDTSGSSCRPTRVWPGSRYPAVTAPNCRPSRPEATLRIPRCRRATDPKQARIWPAFRSNLGVVANTSPGHATLETAGQSNIKPTYDATYAAIYGIAYCVAPAHTAAHDARHEDGRSVVPICARPAPGTGDATEMLTASLHDGSLALGLSSHKGMGADLGRSVRACGVSRLRTGRPSAYVVAVLAEMPRDAPPAVGWSVSPSHNTAGVASWPSADIRSGMTSAAYDHAASNSSDGSPSLMAAADLSLMHDVHASIATWVAACFGGRATPSVSASICVAVFTEDVGAGGAGRASDDGQYGCSGESRDVIASRGADLATDVLTYGAVSAPGAVAQSVPTATHASVIIAGSCAGASYAASCDSTDAPLAVGDGMSAYMDDADRAHEWSERVEDGSEDGVMSSASHEACAVQTASVASGLIVERPSVTAATRASAPPYESSAAFSHGMAALRPYGSTAAARAGGAAVAPSGAVATASSALVDAIASGPASASARDRSAAGWDEPDSLVCSVAASIRMVDASPSRTAKHPSGVIYLAAPPTASPPQPEPPHETSARAEAEASCSAPSPATACA